MKFVEDELPRLPFQYAPPTFWERVEDKIDTMAKVLVPVLIFCAIAAGYMMVHEARLKIHSRDYAAYTAVTR